MNNRKKDLVPSFNIHLPTKVISYPKVTERPMYFSMRCRNTASLKEKSTNLQFQIFVQKAF